MKHANPALEDDLFGKEKIGRLLLRIAPPVMLAQLIIAALAVGTGVGLNTYMARKYAQGATETADAAAGTGLVLALGTWAVFAAVSALIMEPYVRTSASVPEAIADAVVYGRVVCVGSLGSFLEGCWTKVHQARGNMRLPMIAQIAGALVNLVPDPRAHLRAGAGSGDGRGRCGAGHRGRADCIRRDHRPSCLPPPAPPGTGALCTADLWARQPLHPDAGALHGLYRGAEYDSGGLFRRGSHGSGPVIQAADLLFHPAVRAADLHGAGAQL